MKGTMKLLEYHRFFFFLLILILLTGCTENQLEVAEESKVVLLDEYDALTVSVIIKNKSMIRSASFQIKLKFLDDHLKNILEMNEFLIGEEQYPPDAKDVNGYIYKVKPNQDIEGGATFNIYEDIAESELREIINNTNAVKVILLDEEDNEILSEYINDFKELEEVSSIINE